MKSCQTIFLLMSITLSLLNISIAMRTRLRSEENSNSTPQAIDLKNHYGGPNFGSQYGPQNDQFAQFVEANPDTFIPFKTDGKKKIEEKMQFKPYPGYENKLVPTVNKSGEMTNIAPSASKIITPEIAVPKLNIQAEVIHPAEVALPTFKGMKKQFHPVSAYDKETGEIIHDKVLINAPEYTMEKQVMNIKHEHEESINLKTGGRIKKNEEKKLHGQ